MKGQFENMWAGWKMEKRQAFLALISHFFPSTSVLGGYGLVLVAASTHYHERHSTTSTMVSQSVALVTILIAVADGAKKRDVRR